MKYLYIILCCCLAGLEKCTAFKDMSDPKFLSIYNTHTDDYLKKYGYPCEYHPLVTEDGYSVSMFRIPNPNKKPALLVHGIFGSSVNWLLNGPNQSLGYYLYDKGFDVWLADARGNFMNRNHVTLNPKKKEFWRFSWHEIGYYDMPAMIDYMIQKTGQGKVHIVTDSQGGTAFFAMASSRPEINNKILTAQNLAPIAFLKTQSPVVGNPIIINNLKKVQKFVENIAYELLPRTKQSVFLINGLCSNKVISSLCQQIIYIVFGPMSSEFLDVENFPSYLTYTAGSSGREVIHLLQLIRSGKFRQYDHGMMENLRQYRQIEPPDYDLSLITAPVALHYSVDDWFTPEEYVIKINTTIKNSLGMFKVPVPNFHHQNFIWGVNVRKVVHDTAVNIMLKY